MSVKRSVKLGSRVIVRKTSSGRNSHRVNTKNESEIFTDSGYAGRRNSGNGKGATVRTLQTDCRTEGGRVVNFGGEVTVIGKFARTEKAELISLAENLSADRYKRDSDDRILRMKSTRDGFILQTTKGNLAVAIGKHLHRARKGGSLTIVWSRRDLPVRVIWSPIIEDDERE